MLRNKKLTYVTLFSSGGVGCFGFKMEGYHCVATNELISKRMDIQKANKICEHESGYIVGDISQPNIKERIYAEMHKWKKKGNDRIDVVLATPPCQGISVINHKKNSTEIHRNSLVVESIEVIKQIKPRFFLKLFSIFSKNTGTPMSSSVKDISPILFTTIPCNGSPVIVKYRNVHNSFVKHRFSW